MIDDALLEIGTREAALGWIAGSQLNRKVKRRLSEFVHRFPGLRFYRELDPGLDAVEEAMGLRLSRSWRQLRSVLAFLEPGEVEAVRFSGKRAKRIVHEQESWYRFDLASVPQLSAGGLIEGRSALVIFAQNSAPNFEHLAVWRTRHDSSVVAVYPDRRELSLPGGTRTIYDDLFALLSDINAVRLRSGQVIEALDDVMLDAELELELRIEYDNDTGHVLPCRTQASHLYLTPRGTMRGTLDYQAEIEGRWTGERFGTFEASGRVRDANLLGEMWSPMTRKRRDRLELVADLGAEGSFYCPLAKEVRVPRAEATLTFRGGLELWPAAPAIHVSTDHELHPAALKQCELLGARRAAIARDAFPELAPPLRQLLAGLHWPEQVYYANYGLTVPLVNALRFREPQAISLLPPSSRIFDEQGARPFVVLGDEGRERILVTSLDTRHPHDPFVYLVALEQHGQKLGKGAPLSTFLRTLHVVDTPPSS